MDMHGGWGWWMLFGWLWFILFWGGLIWLVAWTVGKLGGRQETSDDALEIARKRFARGEISEEEFLRLKQHLT